MTAARAQALGLQHRPLLDVQLEVGAEPVAPDARSRAARSSSTPFSARTSASAAPLGVAQARDLVGSSVPAKAELPNRLRPKRAPSSSAQSTSTSGTRRRLARVAQARSTPSAAITPSAPSSQPPAGTESRCEPERQRRRGSSLAVEAGPEVAGLVDLGLDPELGEQLGEELARRAPLRRPSTAAGRRPRRRSAAASSRRSAITRAASIAGARATSLSRGVAVERLRQAVGAAAAQREHRQVRVEDLEPQRRAAARSARRPGAGEHPLVAERDRVDAELNASAPGPRGSRSPCPRSQRTSPPGGDSTQTAASFGARIETSTSMWTNWPGIGSIRTSQPSASIQPASCRAACGLGPLLAVADQHHAGLDDASRRRPRATPAVIIPSIGISLSW